MAIKILDIGQCGFDGPRMEELWHEALGAKVVRVANADEAFEELNGNNYDIILVNRILARDGSSGLDVIREIKQARIKTPVMLVSDLSEAQHEAEAIGAVPGFGKADLCNPETLELVNSVATAQHQTNRHSK